MQIGIFEPNFSTVQVRTVCGLQVHVFLGPVCDYSVAPIARYSPYWQTPVLSPGAMAHDLGTDKRTEYGLLTRVGVTVTNSPDSPTNEFYSRVTEVDLPGTRVGVTFDSLSFRQPSLTHLATSFANSGVKSTQLEQNVRHMTLAVSLTYLIHLLSHLADSIV